MPADKKMSIHERMFLPNTLRATLETAKVKFGNEYVKLIPTYQSDPNEHEPSDNFALSHPLVLFSAIGLAMAALTIFDLKRKRISWWFDWISCTITELIGTAILIAWIVYDHWAMAFNLNLLWALPTNLFVIVMPNRLRKRYFLLAALITVALLISWAWLPQKLNPAVIPLVFGFGLRYLANAKIA